LIPIESAPSEFNVLVFGLVFGRKSAGEAGDRYHEERQGSLDVVHEMELKSEFQHV
jgi:hypothetical protein